MAGETCGVCGGDGRIGNSFGLTSTCPACHGSGKRAEDTGFHDVTKTKPSHHRRSNTAVVVEKPTWPSTHGGAELAKEVQESAAVSKETKERLIREIMDHEATHGQCTQTFVKKLRKQVRPRAAT